MLSKLHKQAISELPIASFSKHKSKCTLHSPETAGSLVLVRDGGIICGDAGLSKITAAVSCDGNICHCLYLVRGELLKTAVLKSRRLKNLKQNKHFKKLIWCVKLQGQAPAKRPHDVA